MRYVQRGPEPPELTKYKSYANADWTPKYEDFDAKATVAATFAREQGDLCGYCGGRINQWTGDCHIEHVEAQSTNPARQLDHTNMLASCQGRDAKPRVPEHCGAARGNKPLPVTPFMPDCEAYFSYGSDGRIEAASTPTMKEAAKDTIEILRLKVDRLKAARKAAIEGAIEGLEGMPADVWRAEAAQYDVPDQSGRLAPYGFAIKHVLLSYA